MKQSKFNDNKIGINAAVLRGSINEALKGCLKDFVVLRKKEQVFEARKLLRKVPLSYIGFDVISKKSNDTHGMKPLILYIVAAVKNNDDEAIFIKFAIVIRKKKMLKAISGIFNLPVTFVGYRLNNSLLGLLKLGLTLPASIWDTYICEKALELGFYHENYATGNGKGFSDVRELKAELEFVCSINSLSNKYNETTPDLMRCSTARNEIEQGMIDSNVNIWLAGGTCLAAARLYPAQLNSANENGIQKHLMTVDMPWVKTLAHIQYNGARVDVKNLRLLFEKYAAKLALLQPKLKKTGIENVNDDGDIKAFLQKKGLYSYFIFNGKLDLSNKDLYSNKATRQVKRIHEARELTENQRKLKHLLECMNQDSQRVYPDYIQLGASTGRDTVTNPNIFGLSRSLRHVIIPDDNYGIGEVDYSQFEIGVAAAVYGDADLIAAYNTGDVYSTMAMSFFKKELGEDTLSPQQFKKKHPDLRKKMKTCVLGIINGMTFKGLAFELGCPDKEAQQLLGRFRTLYPDLYRAMRNQAALSATRGYAETISGLRRYRRNANIAPDRWELNWLANFPVQGSASVVFKIAGNRLDLLYRKYKARIIIPLHDSFIFEAPVENLNKVARLTKRIMKMTLQEYFPMLQPKVEINTASPKCWSKK